MLIQIKDMRYSFRMKLSAVKGFWHQNFAAWVKQYLVESTRVVVWLAFCNVVSEMVLKQDRLVTCGRKVSIEKIAFQRYITVFGKVVLRNTFQVFRLNCAKQFFAEIECYFNRCYTLLEQITLFVCAVPGALLSSERSPKYSLT